MKELSLRPYFGTVRVCQTKAEYQREHRRLTGRVDADLETGSEKEGRMSAHFGPHAPAFIVWATKPCYLAHELSHVILIVFDMAGIDPRQANGEPFCYMLSQLMLEAMG